MADRCFDVTIRRFGALGIEEFTQTAKGASRETVDELLERTLGSMTPADRADVRIVARGGEESMGDELARLHHSAPFNRSGVLRGS